MGKIPIVFFGAGPVAAKSLELLSKEYLVEAVVTKGPATKKLKDCPVIELAEALKLKILYANNKKQIDDICKRNFDSEIGVLIDFGVIVSEETINSFIKGIVNSHFSLLPEWRGADPITYSLLSGQKQTGVTLMMLSSGMDEGPVLAQEMIDIETDDTGISLTEKLICLSNEMLRNVLPRYLKNDITPVDQIEYARTNKLNTKPTYSNKIKKQDGKIDWNKPAKQIEREIRAFQPWPRSFTEIGYDLTITITKAKVNAKQKLKTGQVHVTNDKLYVGTREESLELLEIQPAGKKKMAVSDFLRGYLSKLFTQIN